MEKILSDLFLTSNGFGLTPFWDEGSPCSICAVLMLSTLLPTHGKDLWQPPGSHCDVPLMLVCSLNTLVQTHTCPCTHAGNSFWINLILPTLMKPNISVQSWINN